MKDALKSIGKAVVILFGVGLAIGVLVAGIKLPSILLGCLTGAH